jgi:hypothetical protein
MQRLFAIIILIKIARTVFLLVVKWEALRITESIGGSAIIFSASSLAALSVNLLARVIVDRITPTRGIVIGEFL